MSLRYVVCAFLLVVAVACSEPPPPPITASDTEGRFAAHRRYDEVEPRYPGSVLLREAEPSISDVLPCPTIQSMYGTDDTMADVVTYYRGLGFEDGFETIDDVPRVDPTTGEMDPDGEIVRWKGLLRAGGGDRDDRAVDAVLGSVVEEDVRTVIFVDRPESVAKRGCGSGG